MKIEIAKIKVAERIRKEVSKIDELAADIKQNGLITPIAVMPNESGYQLLAGLRRLRAVQSLGWTEIEGNVISPANAEEQLRIEISENEQREPFTFSEKMDFARILKEIESAKAQERILAGRKSAPNPRPPGDRGRVSEIIGEKIGMGRSTYDRASYIAEHGTDEQIAALDSGEKRIKTVYNEIKAVETAVPVTVATVVENPTPTMPTQKFESTPIVTPPTPKVKRISDREKEERAMAMLSPSDREAVERNNAFAAMTPEQKVVDLQAQLKAERSRAVTAETELSRLKDELHNAVFHRDGIISSLERQLESAHAKIAELEGKAHATE